MTDRLLITLCTYNERENLEALIPRIHESAPDADILVIDDNSPDGTGKLADELAQAEPRIHVMHRAEKNGLGAATLAGFQYGIEHGYDYLINLDADLSHPPSAIPAMRAAMNSADVCIGSRYVPGGSIHGWNWIRHFMSWGINWYTRLMLPLKIKDNSGSYRCYRVAKLAEIDYERIRARGYAFQEEILYRCQKVGCKITETPIAFHERRCGESKINLREVLAAIWVIFRLGIDHLMNVPAAVSPSNHSEMLHPSA